MVQGGGLTVNMKEKTAHKSIKNEAQNGLSNLRGTVAMARCADVDSATSQFYINLVNNTFLDHKNDSVKGYGYCVFGKVYSGMDVIDKIAKVKTHDFNYYSDVPVEPILIQKVSIIN